MTPRASVHVNFETPRQLIVVFPDPSTHVAKPGALPVRGVRNDKKTLPLDGMLRSFSSEVVTKPLTN